MSKRTNRKANKAAEQVQTEPAVEPVVEPTPAPAPAESVVETAPAAAEPATAEAKPELLEWTPPAEAPAAAAPAPAAEESKPKTPPAPRAKKEGLRAPQVRILAALAKATEPLTRKEIAAAAPCDVAWCTEFLGSQDPAVRAANDERRFPSLITLGLVKATTTAGGKTAYTITAKGRRAAEQAAE